MKMDDMTHSRRRGAVKRSKSRIEDDYWPVREPPTPWSCEKLIRSPSRNNSIS